MPRPSRPRPRPAPARSTTGLVTALALGSALVMLLVGCSPGADGAPSAPIVVSGAAVDVPVNPAVAAVRMEVRNTTAVDDALLAVASPDGSASIHRSEVDPEGRAVMVAVDRLAVPARSTLVFEPGGLHVMLTGIERDLRVGATVGLDLTFEQAGTVTVEVPVVEPGGGDADGHDHEAAPSGSGGRWR